MSSNRESSDTAIQDVIVVGGGIGGLASAYALRTRGHSVRVLEQASEFGEVGAGLQLAPNATRILAEWGLLDQVVANGVEPRRVVLRDAVTGAELTHLPIDDEFRERYGAPYVVVHRSDLHRILVEACENVGVILETGRRVERVDPTDDAAFTYCAGGAIYESEVVLGLDGLMSGLRGKIIEDEPVASGYVAYRGAVPVESMPVDVDLDDVVAWIGPGCHLVQYPLRQRKMVNQVAVFRSPAFDRGESAWGGPEELDNAFLECCEHVRSSLGSVWRDRHWPMYDREPAQNWVDGRFGLLGDAAHPMLQYLAQGACQALEDAHVLSSEAGQRNGASPIEWPAVLKATQGARVERTAQVQRTARTWGEMWHVNGFGRLLRNELLAARNPRDYTHTDWLYGV